MKSGKQISVAWYAVIDFVTASLAWACFFFIRKWVLKETITDQGEIIVNNKFWLGIIFIPLGWLALYTLVGSYRKLYKKSRLFEFTITFMCSLIGTIVLFFLFLLDDVKTNYSYYYLAFFSLFTVHFIFTFLGRLILLNKVKSQLLSGKVYFNTLMVGSQETAMRIFKETEKNLHDGGYRYSGFLTPDSNGKSSIHKLIPKLGTVDELENIIAENNIRLVVLAMERSEYEQMEDIINRLSEIDVEIKIQPNTLDIISGSVKTSNVMGAGLIDMQTGLMPEWQQNSKRLIDVTVSIFSLIILSPLLIFAALRVKFSSKGPVFYSQERIGYKGQPFRMYKFRSMFDNAEKDGPALSSDNDERITKWGKIMRKWRIDELPQLLNILLGDMSLVGPRPERQFVNFYTVEQQKVLLVLPGITDFASIEFRNENELLANATNPEQYYIEVIMSKKIDLNKQFIENRTLKNYFSILFTTVLTSVRGK